MKQLSVLILLLTGLFFTTNLQAQSIKKYKESASNFSNTPELSGNKYPDSVMYRAYKKGKNGGFAKCKRATQHFYLN